jgi:hypothetical protein
MATPPEVGESAPTLNIEKSIKAGLFDPRPETFIKAGRFEPTTKTFYQGGQIRTPRPKNLIKAGRFEPHDQKL